MGQNVLSVSVLSFLIAANTAPSVNSLRALINACDQAAQIRYENSELKILQHLSKTEGSKIEKEVARRKDLIQSLVLKYRGDAKKLFSEVFGVEAQGPLQVVVRDYGIYFLASEPDIKKVVEHFNYLFHGGFVVGDGSFYKSFKRPDLINAVGMGSQESLAHEFEHMFSSMTSIGEKYRLLGKLRPLRHDQLSDTTIRVAKDMQFRLWANSQLKDELLVRMENGQILQAEQEKPTNSLSGGGAIFTTYRPEELIEPVTWLESEAQRLGVKPWKTKAEVDSFYDRYESILKPIRLRWLNHYNAVVPLLQKAYRAVYNLAQLKALIIETEFDKLSEALQKLSLP